MFWLILVATVATLVLLGMLTIALHNAKHFPRLTIPNPTLTPAPYPPVSILIPARNEAAHISALIHALRGQDYAHIEIIVLDDNSGDNTGELARVAAADDPRVQILSGRQLPAGWLGKNWACHQLAQAAHYDWLLFTDADVEWQPCTLQAILDHAQAHQADMLTVWPTQITQSWAERLVVPMMSFVLLAYLPIALAHNPIAPRAAAANGQCLLFTRQAYCHSGGHHAIRQSIIDDVSLAYHVKRAGLCLRMADGNRLLQCRMYQDWVSVINGYTKVLLGGHAHSTLLLALSTAFHLLLFVLPWPFALWATLTGWHWLALWAFSLGLLGLLIRAITAAIAHQRRRDALLLPLSMLLVSYIALNAIWTQLRHGGPVWKGRRIHLSQESKP
jgi:chlorobactene glucosyltransferase